jgi:hypothetical protein
MLQGRRTFAVNWKAWEDRHATNYEGFEAHESKGSCTGVGSRGRVAVARQRRLRGDCRAGRGSPVKGYRTQSSRHARRGGTRRRQLGDVLRLRQGSGRHSAGCAICPRLRLRPRLRRLSRLRLPRLQGLSRLRLRRVWRMRRLRLQLLHLLGCLPLALLAVSPRQLTDARRHGRVDQDRPGQSVFVRRAVTVRRRQF